MSVTDPEARLWRKSQTAELKLSELGHVLEENRHGLIVNLRVTKEYGGPSGRRRWRWYGRFREGRSG